jgi:hypothetical protein
MRYAEKEKTVENSPASTPVSRLQIPDLDLCGPILGNWLPTRFTARMRLILGRYHLDPGPCHLSGSSGQWFALLGPELDISAVAYFRSLQESIHPEMLPLIIGNSHLTEDLMQRSELIVLPAEDRLEFDEVKLAPLLNELGLVCLGQMRRQTEFPEIEILIGAA